MKVGDKVVGKIVGIKNIGYDNLIFVMIGNTSVLLSEKNNNTLDIIEQEQYKNNETNITKDGYIQCPYESNIECSVYLKGSCKDCAMSKKE